MIFGMLIVRAGHLRVHKWIQSSMILVNVPVVIAWMTPQHMLYVVPEFVPHFAEVAV